MEDTARRVRELQAEAEATAQHVQQSKKEKDRATFQLRKQQRNLEVCSRGCEPTLETLSISRRNHQAQLSAQKEAIATQEALIEQQRSELQAQKRILIFALACPGPSLTLTPFVLQSQHLALQATSERHQDLRASATKMTVEATISAF